MSSILEALRKLERDKLHHPGSTPLIAADLLRPAPHRRRPPLIAIGVIGLGLVAAVGFWGWRSGEPSPATAVPPSPTLTTPVRPIVSPPAKDERAVFEIVAPAAVAAISSAQVPIPSSDAPLQSPLPLLVARQQPVVSAIVYKAERPERLAVIDGMPAMEGTDIAGVQVVEILADRVIFSERGTRFYVAVSP